MAIAQWDRHGSSSHRVVYTGGSSPDGDCYQIFFTTDFISVLLGLMDFSDIVWLANSCCQQNLKGFDIPVILRFVFMKK